MSGLQIFGLEPLRFSCRSSSAIGDSFSQYGSAGLGKFWSDRPLSDRNPDSTERRLSGFHLFDERVHTSVFAIAGYTDGNMGRQISVALSEEDETCFLAFLRADADIRIYRWAASSPEDLLLDRFLPPGPGEWFYTIWNTSFPWSPEYGQWQAGTVRDPELVSKFYLTNTAGAPLLEYMRHPVDKPQPQVHGRLYWNTAFTFIADLPMTRPPFAAGTTMWRVGCEETASGWNWQRTGISIGFRALGPRDTPRVDI